MATKGKRWFKDTKHRVSLARIDREFFTQYVLLYFENDPRLMSIGSGVNEKACVSFMKYGFGFIASGGEGRDYFMRLCGAMKINPREFYIDRLWGADHPKVKAHHEVKSPSRRAKK